MLSLRDLTPTYARMCLQLEKRSRSLGIVPGMKLLLAISGGADSTALAVIYHILASRLGVALAAVHVDHGIRATSASEAEFARNFCEGLAINCQVASIDTPGQAALKKCGLEEAGREARLEILESWRRQLGADFILTGHQAEDLCEDIFLRMLRGAAWPGLSGMGWRNGHVLRPLLHESPEDLKNLLVSCNIPWINDPSNQSLAFRRNRIRHLLMPMLRCENPAISQGLQRLHDLGSLDREFFAAELQKHLAACPWRWDERELTLPRNLLQTMHPALRLRLYNLALSEFRRKFALAGQNEAETLMGIDAAFAANVGGKVIQCPGGITATVVRGDIVLRCPGAA